MHTLKKSFHSIDDYGGAGSVRNWLLGAGLTHVMQPADADILVFNGGADIGTEIYGEQPISYHSLGPPSARDKAEMTLFDTYQGGKKLLLGICRGAQLLNCLNGGSLWQDANNHNRNHLMFDIDTQKQMQITSTHHQMMIPNKKLGRVLAVASESNRKLTDKGVTRFQPDKTPISKGRDIEIVWYQASCSLCIQGHPEYVPGTEYANYSLGLIDKYLKDIRLDRAA